MSRTLSRVLTRQSTKKSSWDPGPPPDGGVQAWTAVLCAHLVITNTWGIINSFGVFQTYYTTALSRPPSDISWIGSIQIFLLFFIGTFTGRLTDAGYFRQVFAVGVTFQLVGVFCTSVAKTYWQVFLAQGICMGLGNGCLFCPCIATVATYFDRKRALALAIAACGSATGGLVFPSMMRELLPRVGFATAMQAIGAVQAVTLGIGCVFLRQRIKPRRNGGLVDWSAWKEGEYVFYAAASFTCFIGLYFPFYYVSAFSRDIIGLGYTESLNLLLVMNGVGIIGRIIPNAIADRVGPINVFVPVGAMCGMCVLCWQAVHTTTGLYVWSCFYGLVAGGIQSLFPAGLSSLNTDVRKAGVRIGMVFTTVSFATLAGPPIAGAIITAADGRYFGAQIFAGVALALGTAFASAARVIKARKVAAESAAASIWRIKV
ncbi:major facilitator superfamily domain-containing protein [Cladorrhinum samala]|uniref:Major facilitator superfamily domain-containing protein n=1 Tax=Cladorrhinum samala TaxID=585594 RepID=A0AAV9HXD5_9PEZI|nr:major facilitator superfamily domain-containing protein [Cladorrhinum samala]